MASSANEISTQIYIGTEKVRKKRERKARVSVSHPPNSPHLPVQSPVLPLPSTFLTVVTVTKRSFVVFVL